MAAGHADASSYTIAKIWYENQLVVERQNSLIATSAVVMQAALATTAMSDKQGLRKAADHFAKLIKDLTE